MIQAELFRESSVEDRDPCPRVEHDAHRPAAYLAVELDIAVQKQIERRRLDLFVELQCAALLRRAAKLAPVERPRRFDLFPDRELARLGLVRLAVRAECETDPVDEAPVAQARPHRAVDAGFPGPMQATVGAVEKQVDLLVAVREPHDLEIDALLRLPR